MPRHTTYLTYRAWCPVRYSYICELCSQESGMIESVLEQYTQHVNKTSSKHSVSPEVGPEKEEKIEAKLMRRLNALKKHFAMAFDDPSRVIEVQNKPYVGKAYNQTFKKGCACRFCGKLQSWYPSFSKPVEHVPWVEWGENSFELIGAAESKAETELKPPKTKLETWIFDGETNDCAATLLEALKKNSHLNIINIQDFNESPLQVQGSAIKIFDVLVEDFEGVAFNVYTRRGVKEDVFQDLILQLTEALEFLHGLDPPIAHNGLTPENVLVGDQSRLVLVDFKDAKIDHSQKNDIKMLGELIRRASGKHRRKYRKIIRKCNGGAYSSALELREDFKKAQTPQNDKTVYLALFLIACFVALLVFIFRWAS